MANPLVSVCIPTHNGERYLAAALNSVLAQTFRDFEIVVSDDASSDATMQIAEEFSHLFEGETRIYAHEPNGIGANWNATVRKSRGRYIKLLMQDDILATDCLAAMVDGFKAHPTAGLVFCRREIIDGGTRTDVLRWKTIYGSLHEAWSQPISAGLLNGPALLGDTRFLSKPENKIGEPTVVMFSRDVIESVGYFDERMRQLLDFEYWYRILRRFDAVYIDRELGKFRLHEFQTSHVNRSLNTRYDAERMMLWTSYVRNLWPCLSPSVRREILWNLVRVGVQRTKRRLVREFRR